MRRSSIFFVLLLQAASVFAQSENCGEALTMETHDRSTTRYSIVYPKNKATDGGPATLLLLIGGGGNIALDDRGCPRALNHNSLIRMRPYLHEAGIATVLVDAPSDYRNGDEGLAGFRITEQHAIDLGKIIADVRARTKGAVWVVGHSRGSLSAANAAARLPDAAAPDGTVLMSAMMVGSSGRKPWVAQTVFNLPLEAIKTPVLIIGHAADSCMRSPPDLMKEVAARIRGSRQQVVAVTGGPVKAGRTSSLAACEVGEPHDYTDQEAELAAGIMRFVRGGQY